MELQAVRYAAMVSALTFDMLVEHYEQFLKKNDDERDARDRLLDFLNWDDSDDQTFGQNTQIVLASAEFSKELTTSILWLNEQGLDIRCVRLRPYDNCGQVLLDVQTIIPIPEAEEYQIRIREKRQRERAARESNRDYSKFDVTIGDEQYPKKNKRKMIFLIVSAVLDNGGSLQRVLETVPAKKIRVFDGALDAEQIREQLDEEDSGGSVHRSQRYFCDDGQPFQIEGKTYILSNQWGRNAPVIARNIAGLFPELKIKIEKTNTIAE